MRRCSFYEQAKYRRCSVNRREQETSLGTKNNPGKFDCYANADPDEPMFVLLGRDKHAPTLVWLWSTLRELDNEDPAKVQEARECCFDMMRSEERRVGKER